MQNNCQVCGSSPSVCDALRLTPGSHSFKAHGVSKMMQCVATLEVSMQVIKKNGLFYAQVFEVETLNLVFETDCLTKSGAIAALANFVSETLEAQ